MEAQEGPNASDAPRSLCAAAAPCCSSCSSTRSSTRRAGRPPALRLLPWPRGEPRVRRPRGAEPRNRRRWRRAAARSPQAAGQRSRRQRAVQLAQRAAQARMWLRRTRQRPLELRRRLKRPRLPEAAPAACAPAARTGGARRPASSRRRRGSAQSKSCQPFPPTAAAGAGEPQRGRGLMRRKDGERRRCCRGRDAPGRRPRTRQLVACRRDGLSTPSALLLTPCALGHARRHVVRRRRRRRHCASCEHARAWRARAARLGCCFLQARAPADWRTRGGAH